MTTHPNDRRGFGSLAGLMWLTLPFLAFVGVLFSVWFNAPIWDDYDLILNETMMLLDAGSARDWVRMVIELHNEHRTAFARLASWTLVTVRGHIDFRLLVAIGVATLYLMAVLIWLEFRDHVPAPLFAAASLLLFQWSYYEAVVTPSAGVANMTAVTFSFVALFFALKPWRLAPAATIAFGVLAAGSLANGLFALPIAAFGATIARRRRLAALYAAAAIAVWVLYFFVLDYRRPPGHPSPFAVFTHLLPAAQLFLVNLGSIVPGIWRPTIVGASMVVVLAWLARHRIWQAHPTAAMWILFLLASTVVVTVGRIGFGVIYTARYALFSSALVALALLLACSLWQRWTTARTWAIVALCAAVSVGVSLIGWRAVQEYSTNGKRLSKAVAATPEVQVQPYFGMFYPVSPHAEKILVEAEKRGLYVPRRDRVFPTQVRLVDTLPAGARSGGHVDRVTLTGNRVEVGGWTDIPAIVPNRSILVFPSTGTPRAGAVSTDDRADVAMIALHPDLQFGGFRVTLEYPSEELARRAAATICVAFESPASGAAILPRQGVQCNPGQSVLPRP